MCAWPGTEELKTSLFVGWWMLWQEPFNSFVAEISRPWCQKDLLRVGGGASELCSSLFRRWSGAFSNRRSGFECAAEMIF